MNAPAPSASSEHKAAETIDQFVVTGGATVEIDGNPNCFVVKDDADPANKYFHDTPEWHDLAKTAKNAKAYVTAISVERQTQKGLIRWLTSLSLRG